LARNIIARVSTIAFDRRENATRSSRTIIVRARVIVIANGNIGTASESRGTLITIIRDTRISSRARNQRVLTTQNGITNVFSARIVVVARRIRCLNANSISRVASSRNASVVWCAGNSGGKAPRRIRATWNKASIRDRARNIFINAPSCSVTSSVKALNTREIARKNGG
jgi:hypothetical protein